MCRYIVSVVLAGVVAVALLAPSALAVSKVAPGHEPFEIACEGLGSITISVQRSENRGAVQIVGRKGHLIPVEFEFTILNLTQDEVVFSETETFRGHRNQATITCTTVFFEGPASELELGPGEQLPPDVAPTDILRVVFTAEVILKP
jgi:hypothetical protein